MGISFSLFILLSIVVIALPLILLFTLHKYLASKSNKLSCKICGYKWDKRNLPEGNPIQINKDLIEKGNILLEQEEATRRRQQREEDERRRRQ